jgi:hypothetical protein
MKPVKNFKNYNVVTN